MQSAAVNLSWSSHRINLIDTPGHVDFRVEVERCLRVLDGIVCVIDASAGVQPQTLTVWSQSLKFKLPATFFINKLDKEAANFAKSVDSIEQKLGIRAVKTVIPLNEKHGVLDVLTGNILNFSENDQWEPVKMDSREFEIFQEARSELCYSIADNDEDFMIRFLDDNAGDHRKIDNQSIIEALRNLTLASRIATVSCGSAIRSLHCVRPVLDAIVDFFPDPKQRNEEIRRAFGDELAALVFKVRTLHWN